MSQLIMMCYSKHEIIDFIKVVKSNNVQTLKIFSNNVPTDALV